MAESISRLTQRNFVAKDLVSEVTRPHPSEVQESGSKTFLDLVVNNLPDHSALGRNLSAAEHRAARRKVFESLVTTTLEQPGHPYGGLRGRMKQEMIQAITDELVASHYKV